VPQDKADARIIDYDIASKPPPDIMADYRQWRTQQEERIGTHSPDCHMWPRHERCMIHRLADALEKERQVSSEKNLTDEERAAAEYFSKWGTWTAAAPHAKAMAGLLEKTK
jgi:hypothetical protein